MDWESRVTVSEKYGTSYLYLMLHNVIQLSLYYAISSHTH